MPVGASDLTRFRADVHPEGSDTILGDAFLHEGQRVYAAGFLREPERAAAGDDPYVLRIVPARVIERPWWEEVNSQELIYLALPRGVRAKGMSGGPIAVWNDRAGRTEVVGIMLGRVGLRVLGITFDEVHVAVRCPTLDPARLGNAVPVD